MNGREGGGGFVKGFFHVGVIFVRQGKAFGLPASCGSPYLPYLTLPTGLLKPFSRAPRMSCPSFHTHMYVCNLRIGGNKRSKILLRATR